MKTSESHVEPRAQYTGRNPRPIAPPPHPAVRDGSESTASAPAVAPSDSEQPSLSRPQAVATPAVREVLVTVTAVGLGGVLGANLRYLVGNWAQTVWGTSFPWGTLIINVAGSLLIGTFLTLATERLSIRPGTRLFVATGMLGAFTTFSTMSYELVHLLQTGAVIRAGLYVLASLSLGLIAVISGRALALAL